MTSNRITEIVIKLDDAIYVWMPDVSTGKGYKLYPRPF